MLQAGRLYNLSQAEGRGICVLGDRGGIHSFFWNKNLAEPEVVLTLVHTFGLNFGVVIKEKECSLFQVDLGVRLHG